MTKAAIFSALGILATLASLKAFADCRSAAIWAAENEYGNDPVKTRVKELDASTFEVTVGIGNEEDGAHTYRVEFEAGSCNPRTAIVCDLTQPGNNDGRVCHE